MLAGVRSELMKQVYKVEYLDTCISELQAANLCSAIGIGRCPSQLVMKEKALRDAQIRSIHEMGELKRAQELRVDKFSVQKLRESHDTIQKLT